MAKIPTNTLATMAWLRTFPEFGYDMISDTLTGDNELIAASGFLTVRVAGGSSDIYVPRRSPVMEIKSWACHANGDRQYPPWDEANELMEIIRERCLDHRSFRGVIDTEPGYDKVCVPSAYLLTEPMEQDSDDGRFACYSVDLQIHWTRRIA